MPKAVVVTISVTFTPGRIDMYPDDTYNDQTKPAVGNELNKDCDITLCKISQEDAEKLRVVIRLSTLYKYLAPI